MVVLGVFAVNGHVPLALLDGCLVAFRDLVYNPLGDVFGGGIEWQNIVQMSMVEFAMNKVLDVLKVDYHAVSVEFLCSTKDGNNPVVAMGVFALGFVGKVQPMTPGYFHAF